MIHLIVKKQKKTGIHLTDKQKKALKIGAAITATALIAIGAYQVGKSGKLDSVINIGRKAVGESNLIKTTISESINESLNNANPLKGTIAGTNNCVPSAIAGFLRQAGYNVTAKSTNGIMQMTGGVVEECFKNAEVLDGSAIKFGKSKQDAAEMLVKKFGDNASGICDIQWKSGKGHCFSWKITDGITEFMDFQNGLNDSQVTSFWNNIDKTAGLTIARLDNAELNLEALSKYVDFS